MQRGGQPSVFASTFDSVGRREHEMAQSLGGEQQDQRRMLRGFPVDPPLSLGQTGHASATVDPPSGLPARFTAGQESASVLQLTKRPKLRAKDVAHRQSLAPTEPLPMQSPRFWNMDTSFVAPIPDSSPDQFPRGTQPVFRTPPAAGLPDVFLVTLLFGAGGVTVSATPGTTVRTLRDMAAGIAEVHPDQIHLFMDDAILRLERQLSFYLVGFPIRNVTIRVGSARGHQLQGSSLPEPLGHASWRSAISPPGSSVNSDPEVEPFIVSLVLPDGHVLAHPTWPTITVQLLRRQVAITLHRSHDTVFFVCHGTVLDLERRLSDEPPIRVGTLVHVFFTLAQAMQALGERQLPPTPPPPGPFSPPPAPMGPELPPGFVRAQRNPAVPPPTRNLGSTQRGSANDKLRASFKLPRFNGDARQ
jgi:hypothetical protein